MRSLWHWHPNTRLMSIPCHTTRRSLFEKDKLLFAFLLCARILESKGNIDPDEWMFLLTGGLGSAPDRPNPAPTWLTDRSVALSWHVDLE